MRPIAAVLPLALVLASCQSADTAGPSSTPVATRTYVMGFTPIPPRPDTALALRTIDLWATRADAGLLLYEPPWARLLAGEDAEALVRANELGLASYYRGKGLRLIASVDATNGVDRSGEATGLVALGRHLAEPEVRAAYVRYVAAFASIIRPEYLAVASETNLVRAAAPPALYRGLVDAAAAAGAAARAASPATRVFTTVQVEAAWGRLGGGANGAFAGIARDRADFPFAEAIGLSSYPYLGGFNEPEDVPLDYYARLGEGTALPFLVIEGGWTSASLGAIASSPDEQRRYVERHLRILDAARAAAYFQITFTDLDLAAITLPPGSILPLFAANGLVDANLAPKPALAAWDAAFRRPYRP